MLLGERAAVKVVLKNGHAFTLSIDRGYLPGLLKSVERAATPGYLPVLSDETFFLDCRTIAVIYPLSGPGEI